MTVPFSRITFGEKVSDSVLLEARRFPADQGLFEEIFPQQPPSLPPAPPWGTDCDRPGSVPCSTGPSNIYSSHKLLPTASLAGHCSELGEGRAGEARSYDSHIKDNAENLYAFLFRRV